MAASDTGIDIIDFAVGHQLGFFKRTLYRLHGRLNIDYHAFFQAAGNMLAKAYHFYRALWLQLTDYGDNFGCAYV